MECLVETCPKVAYCRGWCQKHYTRWLRHGDTSIAKRRDLGRIEGVSDRERILSKILVVGECWEWQGNLVNGYGRVVLSGGRWRLAHRATYEEFVGPIPEGLTLDHLCYNRACVNPDHLEPIPMAENTRRAAERRHEVATLCQARLHIYPENRIVEPSTGKTRCKLCQQEARRRYKAKVREAMA